MDAYPVDFAAPYGDGARSRGLAVAGIFNFVKALLLVPHAIALSLVTLAASVSAYAGYFVVAVTGQMPPGLTAFLTGAIGWTGRSSAWMASLDDAYPPFSLDSAGWPVRLEVAPAGTQSRAWAVAGILFLKPLAALPHLIVLIAVQWIAAIAAWIGFFVIAFTGTASEGIHTFVEGTIRWTLRVFAWVAGLVDEYPPFSVD